MKKKSLPIPDNQFYNTFDTEFLVDRGAADYRTPFERDRDRIIHSSALRRLQAKTQVFLSGEYDFYRTRLTHSIEVGQIGRSICNYLRRRSPLLGDDFYIDPDLVEAACLAHDLGHPPFGHSGEYVLNRLMRDSGGFEGNAQTLRMITEIIYPKAGRRVGMKPTRALIDGVLKYKALRRHLKNPERYFLYDDQEKYLDFVFDDAPYRRHLTSTEQLNHFRSVECQIMDWADDTAYCLNDIVDSIQARFLSREQLESWAAANQPDAEASALIEEIIASIIDGDTKRIFSRKIGDFIAACRLETRENFMSARTERYRHALIIDPALVRAAELYKRIASDIVFDSAQLQQMRYKWESLLERLFVALRDNYLNAPERCHKLLPEVNHHVITDIEDRQERHRAICDHLAGMTDRFAIHTYKRLFEPGFGSIDNLV